MMKRSHIVMTSTPKTCNFKPFSATTSTNGAARAHGYAPSPKTPSVSAGGLLGWGRIWVLDLQLRRLLLQLPEAVVVVNEPNVTLAGQRTTVHVRRDLCMRHEEEARVSGQATEEERLTVYCGYGPPIPGGGARVFHSPEPQPAGAS
jgi:hypothetical protein